MIKKLLLLSLAFWLAACTANQPTPSPTRPVSQIEPEEQAVYAFLLADRYQHREYVIMDTIATNASGVDAGTQTIDYVLQNMHNVDAGTVDSFKGRNDAAHSLSPNMDIGGPYTLLSEAAKKQIFGQNQSGWDIFYSRYPQAPGITTFSRVGFNEALDQALVYMGTQSNWLAGAGFYFLLKKANGGWSIDQQVMVWIS